MILDSELHDAIIEIYCRAKAEAGYNATRFIGVVSDHEGSVTARNLLRSAKVSAKYTAPWERDRLDLTVERTMLAENWKLLFKRANQAIAVPRLKQYCFFGPLPDLSGD